MSNGPSSSLLGRDVLLFAIALVLLAGPLWAPALHLNDSTYRYDRAEVTATGTNIEYVDSEAVPYDVRISDDIGCSDGLDVRVCAFERLVLDGRTVPSGVYGSNPDNEPRGFPGDRYRYVLIDETVYEPTYTPNRSVQRSDGLYRIDLSLEPVPAERALRRVSLRVDSTDLPAPVARTARNGNTTTHRAVDVPETPVRLENGTYYRIFLRASSTDGSPLAGLLDFLLRYAAPIAGLSCLVRLVRRVEFTLFRPD